MSLLEEADWDDYCFSCYKGPLTKDQVHQYAGYYGICFCSENCRDEYYKRNGRKEFGDLFKRMYNDGYTPERIAKVTGAPLEAVKDILGVGDYLFYSKDECEMKDFFHAVKGATVKPPDAIAWAIHYSLHGYFNCSYLQFYCEEMQREEASKCFQKAFDAVRKETLRSCGRDEECDRSATTRTGWCLTTLTEDGFIATFGMLQNLDDVQWVHMSLNSGGQDPVEEAASAVLYSFPSICYQGVENYIYQNTRGGEMWYKEYSSGAEVPPVNEILGKELSSALKTEEFWQTMKENMQWSPEKDFAEVLDFFRVYVPYIQDDTLERLLNLAEDIDPAIRTTLEQELQESPIA